MEYGHGGDVYRNRNVELDFSINVNPLGMPNFVWEAAMKSIALSTRYPDSTCGALRARMSELTGIPGEMMIFGNGAAELIFRLVYELAGCRKPVLRLWISSMEDSAIREGFSELRPGAEYGALYQSALCRQRAD